jgi:TonB-dependent starch-binding outer membrane protein SusC
LPQNDNNDQGIVASGLLGCAQLACPAASGDTTRRGYGFLTPAEAFKVFAGQNIERFTGSVSGNFRPWSFLTLRGVAGTDVTNRGDNETTPPGEIPLDQERLDGDHVANRAQIFSYTANFGAEATFRLSPVVTSTSSVGVQYYKNVLQQVFASGRKLAPGTNSLDGVSIPTVGENTNEFVTLGGYVEERVGIRDRLFITAALRGDDNSAFGANFNFITYPKLSGSWVISEEPFFPSTTFLSSLRLRAAWGRSGRQPGPNDARRFFTPVTVKTNGVDVPAITVGSLGNADLKPEKTREVEGGFDADLWEQRLHVEFTYYDKSSKDALIARRLAPSLGVSTTQFVNLGKVSNKGVEILLNAQLVNRPDVSWSVTASAWGNRNRLVDLGIDPATGQKIKPIIFGLGGATQRHQEDYPLGGYWDFNYTFEDTNGDGLISPAEVTPDTAQSFQGTPSPTHGGTLSTEFNFLRHFRLYGLLDGRFGNRLDNSTEQFRCLFTICRGARQPTASLAEQARTVAALFNALETGYFEDAGFVKLREVSLTYFAPARWARSIGASALSLTLTGRNLATWTDYSGVDPELNDDGQSNFNTADFLTQPPVRYFIARINVTF